MGHAGGARVRASARARTQRRGAMAERAAELLRGSALMVVALAELRRVATPIPSIGVRVLGGAERAQQPRVDRRRRPRDKEAAIPRRARAGAVEGIVAVQSAARAKEVVDGSQQADVHIERDDGRVVVEAPQPQLEVLSEPAAVGLRLGCHAHVVRQLTLSQRLPHRVQQHAAVRCRVRRAVVRRRAASRRGGEGGIEQAQARGGGRLAIDDNEDVRPREGAEPRDGGDHLGDIVALEARDGEGKGRARMARGAAVGRGQQKVLKQVLPHARREQRAAAARGRR